MKKLAFAYLLMVMSFITVEGQMDSTMIISEWESGKLTKIVPTGPAKLRKERPFEVIDHPSKPYPAFQAVDIFPSQNWNQETNMKAQGKTLSVGNSFEANHLYGSIPSDPAVAISNDGRVVSLDNSTIAYFKENGDTIVKYGLPHYDWYQDSALVASIFDPRIVYDSYSDRFIAVTLYLSADYADSRVLVSFSQALGPDSISWNHYQLHCDSIYDEQGEELHWVDFPNIAVNKNELFISCNVFDYDSTTNSNSGVKNLLLQIEKMGGYTGQANLDCREWKNILNTDGNNNDIVVPLGDAFQSAGYGPGCYMVSNFAGNSTKFFWYELTGDINDAGAQIIAHSTASSFFYSFPSFATQLGGDGGDRIRFGDCRVASGFYQNGKLHFVFHRSDNGWGEIVYAKITLANNSFEANTWGGDEDNLNSFYPSIAPFGRDSTEENSIITFSRSGPTIFPQVCAINFDTSWSPSVTVVKAGLGLLDRFSDLVAPWDSLERIGDYSDIQRRYNDPNNACWLIGSYAAGPMVNHFGVPRGLKSWIAEIGDSTIVTVPEPAQETLYKMYPNPIDNGSRNLNFRFADGADFGTLHIITPAGKSVLDTKYRGASFSLQIPDLPTGIYFIKFDSQKHKKHAAQKLLIYP